MRFVKICENSCSSTSRAGKLLLLLFLLSSCIQPGTRTVEPPQAASAPEMAVATAWNGYARTPGWTELTVTLRNEQADWRGDLVLNDETHDVTYRWPVELPARSRKQYRLPLHTTAAAGVVVQLRPTAGGETQTPVLEEEIRLRAPRVGRVCAASEDVVDRVATYGTCEQVVVISALAELPEASVAWDTVDVLLLNGVVSAELTAAQQEALVAWVAAGGTLVLSGGATLPQTLAGLPPEVSVATTERVAVMDVPPIEIDAGQPLAVAQLRPAAAAGIPQGQPLLTSDDAMLAVRQDVGLGMVLVLGWDLNQSAEPAWAQTLWAHARVPATQSYSGQAPLVETLPDPYSLFNVPGSAFPRLWPAFGNAWLLAFPLYILLMGPGTLLIVRRLRRPILAWVLLPLWIALMLATIALGLHGSARSALPLVHDVALVIIPQGERPARGLPARVKQGTAIYAPRARKLTWSAQQDSETVYPRPLYGSYTFESYYNAGNPFPVTVSHTGERVEMAVRDTLGVLTWGSEGLLSTPPHLESALAIEALRDGAVQLTGSLESDVPLEGVILLLRDQDFILQLTDVLTPHHELEVQQRIDTPTSGPYNFCQRILQNGSYYTARVPPLPLATSPTTSSDNEGDCYLAGKSDGVPFSTLQTGGRQIGESCLIFQIPCPVQASGPLSVQLQPNSNKVINGWIGYPNGINISPPYTVVEYQVPPYVSLGTATALKIVLESPALPSTSLEELLLWDWETSTWDPLPLESLPVLRLEGENARPFFHVSSQSVRLQLTPTSTTTGSSVHQITLALTLEGYTQ